MDNDTIKDLGLCPICQKGHIMKGSLGYYCNYFKNMNDKCTFNIDMGYVHFKTFLFSYTVCIPFHNVHYYSSHVVK